jgi:hypothetical protein
MTAAIQRQHDRLMPPAIVYGDLSLGAASRSAAHGGSASRPFSFNRRPYVAGDWLCRLSKEPWYNRLTIESRTSKKP